MQVIEQFTAAKKNCPELNEDNISLSAHFAAVLDGASSYHPGAPRTLGGMPIGRFASQTVGDRLKTLDPDMTAVEAVRDLSTHLEKAVQARAEKEGIKEFSDMMAYPATTFLCYSARRDEIWRVSDSPFALFEANGQGKQYDDELAPIAVFAAARGMFLAGHMAAHPELKEQDLVGKDPSLPLMQQMVIGAAPFVNCDDADVLGVGKFGFGTINGHQVPEKYIKTYPVGGAAEAVLATDGYLKLFNTLAATEDYLQGVMKRDPLMIREHPHVRGLQAPGGSFDDRAYLRLRF